MKKTLLVLVEFVSVIGFMGCKKQAPMEEAPAMSEPAAEQPAADATATATDTAAEPATEAAGQ